jgi:glycosyltransferase involved in cell wall biosynthesis
LQEVFQRFGLSTVVVPNIIDLSRFKPRSSITESWCVSPHLIVTRPLEPLYDVGTALRAFAIVREKRAGARMTIAGGGPDRDTLIALAHDLGVAPYVKFVGRLENDRIPELYVEADIFVNSSLYDNMPISILEALASGVPVVSTDVCGIPFLVEHQKTGILVPPRDAAAMAQAVLDLLDNPSLAEQLVRAGRNLVQQYTWSHVRPRLLEVYSGLINQSVSKARA